MSTGIRALTIRPPWSDLITTGAKTIENRPWGTSWRGVLLVHAARQLAPDAREGIAALPPGHRMVFGAVVAVARLDAIHDDDGPCTPWSRPGHQHWELHDAQPLTTPVPCAGALSLWRPTDQLLQAVTDVASPGALRLLRAR